MLNKKNFETEEKYNGKKFAILYFKFHRYRNFVFRSLLMLC